MKTNLPTLLTATLLGLGIFPLTAQENILEAALDDLAPVAAADLPEIPAPPAAAPDLPEAASDLPEAAPQPGVPDRSIQPDDGLPEIGAEMPAEGEGGGSTFAPLEEQKREMEQTSEGYLIKDAGLNDIFQFLAKSAGRQYFHNLKINGPDYMVTGHLDDGDPLNQMEELAFMYGLSLHTKGNTIYALTQAQLGQLPSTEFQYQLKYLRPSDMEQIKDLIKPMLTPGTGIVNFEPKTNTIIIIDTATRIEAAQNLLQGIDKAKGQIIVETKILRINSTVGQRIGVDWADDLGASGVPLQVTSQIGNIFGLPTKFSGDVSTSSPGDFTSDRGSIILTPTQVTGLLRALNDGGISNQVSNPTLITEDNEAATISIIDRVPIITSTTTPGGASGQTTVTEEVRYKIDSSDKAITEDPDNHREIGISIAVTPTLLPDGTVRMKLRPRSAQITGEVVGVGVGGTPGNRYPRVTESMVETLARIPDGSSLIVGGFYGEVQEDRDNKVPLLGDIPVINFFFKNKEARKEHTSLVFIVTPTSYDPTSKGATRSATNHLQAKVDFPKDYDTVDPYNPGPAHKPNMARTIRGMQPSEAPYFPRQEELTQDDSTRTSVSPSRPRFNSVRRR